MPSKQVRNVMYTQFEQFMNIEPSVKSIEKIVKSLPYIDEYAFIRHDKDTAIEDDYDDDKIGEKMIDPTTRLIKPHWHIMMRFTKRVTIKSIAKNFKESKETQFQAFDKSYNSGFSYLVHKTTGSQHKYQYSTDEVTASFDFKERLTSIGKAVSKKRNKDINLVLDLYANQKITYQELEEELGTLEMAKRKILINNITEQIMIQKHEEFLEEMTETNTPVQVFWLYGKGGKGKSVLAKKLALQYALEEEIFEAVGSNDPFQGMNKRRHTSIVIWDDIRPEDFTYQDLLMILDNYNYEKRPPVRFKNPYLDCKVLILTTPFEPSIFYSHMKNIADGDDMYQLFRRINLTIYVTADKITYQKLEKVEENVNTPYEALYNFVDDYSVPNPVKNMFSDEEKTKAVVQAKTSFENMLQTITKEE